MPRVSAALGRSRTGGPAVFTLPSRAACAISSASTSSSRLHPIARPAQREGLGARERADAPFEMSGVFLGGHARFSGATDQRSHDPEHVAHAMLKLGDDQPMPTLRSVQPFGIRRDAEPVA